MTEYTKRHKSGLYIAKRGYCYFAYKSMEQAYEDDAQVSRNLERLNSGEQVFNRCYDGKWLFYTRKLSEFNELTKYWVVTYHEEVIL